MTDDVFTELLALVKVVKAFNTHNQTDHNIFYQKLIELEEENKKLRSDLNRLKQKLDGDET